MAHVLLIDDDPAFLPVQVRQALPDHLITSVTTGAAGIEQIRSLPPDVVLLDVLVSRQSGLAVYEHCVALVASATAAYDAEVPEAHWKRRDAESQRRTG